MNYWICRRCCRCGLPVRFFPHPRRSSRAVCGGAQRAITPWAEVPEQQKPICRGPGNLGLSGVSYVGSRTDSPVLHAEAWRPRQALRVAAPERALASSLTAGRRRMRGGKKVTRSHGLARPGPAQRSFQLLGHSSPCDRGTGSQCVAGDLIAASPTASAAASRSAEAISALYSST